MTLGTVIRRSLWFHRRAHLGVMLGAAVGSAALLGALVVGDSVRASLRQRALERLGWVEAALDGGDRVFPQTMARRVVVLDPAASWQLNTWHCTGVLRLAATASRPDGTAHALSVNVLGVDSGEFWQSSRLTHAPPDFALVPKGFVVLNQPLAAQLRVGVGDEVLLRLHRPAALSPEAALAPRSDAMRVLRLKVHGIAPASQMGDFSLRATATPPMNAFLPINDLAAAVGLDGKANLLLVGDIQSPTPAADGRLGGVWQRVRSVWAGQQPAPQLLPPSHRPFSDWRIVWAPELEDFSLALELRTNPPAVELRSRRVFLEPPVVAAVERARQRGASGPRPDEDAGRLAGRTDAGRSTAQADVTSVFAAAQPLLTYLANLLIAGTNATPYSMVTAAGPPWTPADLRDDEILVNQWLADDLRVRPGDVLTLVYFDAESGARLLERTNTFRVRAIVPMQLPWADRTLMPDFPGIEKAESTRDWDAGFPLTYKIRPKDEDYWRRWRGTPKAFITLAAGQKLWANRFGNLTAVRWPLPTDAAAAPAAADSPARENRSLTQHASAGVEDYRAGLEKTMLALLKPEQLGLRFEPARALALKAAGQSQDFGGLFLGFSFFLIAAALVLMALLFRLGLEQRAPEIGTLLALGFTPAQVRKVLLGEGAALALVGGLLGTPGGLVYAKLMLGGLSTVWRDAVGRTSLEFHATGQTLAIGLGAGVVVGVLTVWLALRQLVRRAPRALLAGDVEGAEAALSAIGAQGDRQVGGTRPNPGRAWRLAGLLGWRGGRRPGGTRVSDRRDVLDLRVGWLTLLAGVALVGWMILKGETTNPGVFFGAGALVLVAGLAFVSAWLTRQQAARAVVGSSREGLRQTARPAVSLGLLGLRGCARRRRRSLAVVAMLACGSFLIVSIGVFRLDAGRSAWRQTSGTGGFALVGQTAMPVAQDLNAPSGRAFFALRNDDLAGVSVVPFRVLEGDEASCLSLNRPQRPRLLGVRPALLQGRFTFTKGAGWNLLRPSDGGGGRGLADPSDRSDRSDQSDRSDATVVPPVVPAIGDANSVRWAMGKRVGDTLDYLDEQGRRFQVRIVGTVANSILQGGLLIDEAQFVERFPSVSGHRFFLVDAPSNRVAEVSAALSRALQDLGLELTPAAQRLAQFNAVQNTYLGTFQALGGLGLLLGSAGLGTVVLRNVLERRGELALLLAVGFRKRALQRLLLIEHGALLGLGLAIGAVAAAVAVLPAVLTPGEPLPWRTLGLTLLAVLFNGLIWTAAATRMAVRGELLAALRNA